MQSSLLLAWLVPFLSLANPFELRSKIGYGAPDFSFETTEGQTRRVEDYRGKWLLLQFGATWNSPSKATAAVFSRMRRAFDGGPFEFVALFDEPTPTDVELFDLYPTGGVRAVTNKRGIPEFYRIDSYPAWYLIDPHGVVQLAGSFESAGELQRKVIEKLAGEKAFAAGLPEPSAAERLLEDALYASARQDRQAQFNAWDKALAADPDNAGFICGKARAIAWLKGYPEANVFLRQEIEKLPEVPDSLQIFAANYGWIEEKNLFRSVRTLAALGEKHPRSEYLRAYNLLWTKNPDEIDPAEAQSLLASIWQGGDEDAAIFLAFHAMSKGRYDAAEKLLAVEKRKRGTGRLAEAYSFHLQGDDTRALEEVGPASGSYSVETANPTQAWQEMLRFAVVQDWPQTTAFGRRYEQVRPERILGPLFQLLAALRSQNADHAAELRTRIEKFVAESPRYAATRPLLSREPGRDDFLEITDERVRFDTALFCMLRAEMDGQMEKAKKIGREAMKAFRPSTWFYPMLHITIPRDSPAKDIKPN